MDDTFTIHARLIREGQPIPEGMMYGLNALALMRQEGISEAELRPYRSSAYFARKKLYGEEAARKWEDERKDHHAKVSKQERDAATLSDSDAEYRKAMADQITARFANSKAMPRDKSTAPRQDVTPEEIAETMAEVNARSAERQAERDRRAAVADELARMGLSDGVARK